MITVIIQTRTGSTRLPNKALEMIGDRTMVQHVIDRVKQVQMIEQLNGSIVVAVPDTDVRMISHVLGNPDNSDVKIFTGSELDVLDRYYRAYKRYGGNIIVRITGDCPLVDPQLIADAVTFYSYMLCDYVTTRPSYPDGMDVEVFSPLALEKAWKEATDPHDREHVCTYMTVENGFDAYAMELEIPFGDIKLSVDTQEDLDRVRRVYELYGDDIGVDVVAYLEDEI